MGLDLTLRAEGLVTSLAPTRVQCRHAQIQD